MQDWNSFSTISFGVEDRWEPEGYYWLLKDISTIISSIPDDKKSSFKDSIPERGLKTERRMAELLASRWEVKKVCERKNIIVTDENLFLNPPEIDSKPCLSLSHSKNAISIFLMKQNRAISVGCDVEEIIDKDNIKKKVLCKDEHRFLEKISPLTAITLIFSLKESLFKASSRIVSSVLGFDAVEVVEIDVVASKAVLSAYCCPSTPLHH